MAIFVKTLRISKAVAKKAQKFLDSEGTGGCDVWGYWSVRFPKQNRGVDIKVVDGDTPYVDPVLFETVKDGKNVNWHEVGVAEPSDTLVGDYTFEDEGDTYIVKVRVRS
jgi:hypothetical protein